MTGQMWATRELLGFASLSLSIGFAAAVLPGDRMTRHEQQLFAETQACLIQPRNMGIDIGRWARALDELAEAGDLDGLRRWACRM